MILTAMKTGEAAVMAALGWGTVFLGLIALLLVVSMIGLFFKKKPVAKVETPAPVVAVEEEKPLAPGSAGQLKLHDVEPKTAAMLMAIVADKMGKPLNELHFISIKEVK